MNRRKESVSKSISARMLNAEELAVYIGVGRTSALAFGEDIGAKRKIGKRTLYDKAVIDRHFDRLAENQACETCLYCEIDIDHCKYWGGKCPEDGTCHHYKAI